MRVSAGILLFRRTRGDVEVLLAHPGGPFFQRRDNGHWSIPKGEPEPDEPLPDAADREFFEETGHHVRSGSRLDLGSVVQKGGKVVHAWAVEGDLDVSTARSVTFELEWPPRSGHRASFPEIDRIEWFSPAEARGRIKEAQVPFIDRLEDLLTSDAGAPADDPAPGEGRRR